MTHYNLVHKPIPVPQALKMADTKATVDQEWDKLKNLSAWEYPK